MTRIRTLFAAVALLAAITATGPLEASRRTTHRPAEVDAMHRSMDDRHLGDLVTIVENQAETIEVRRSALRAAADLATRAPGNDDVREARARDLAGWLEDALLDATLPDDLVGDGHAIYDDLRAALPPVLAASLEVDVYGVVAPGETVTLVATVVSRDDYPEGNLRIRQAGAPPVARLGDAFGTVPTRPPRNPAALTPPEADTRQFEVSRGQTLRYSWPIQLDGEGLAALRVDLDLFPHRLRSDELSRTVLFEVHERGGDWRLMETIGIDRDADRVPDMVDQCPGTGPRHPVGATGCLEPR